MLKLTTRQQTFLDKLFELYREFKGPVHYSIVAEKLGVNKFSAYDMLKVLEDKGVAASSYVLNSDQAESLAPLIDAAEAGGLGCETFFNYDYGATDQ